MNLTFLQGVRAIVSLDNVYVEELLKSVGASDNARRLFEKSNDVSNQEILTIRRSYERFLVDYNLQHVEKEFVAYYVVNIRQRTIMGLYPATYDELIFALFYVSIIVFGNNFFVKVKEWIALCGDYMREIDKSAYNLALGRVCNVLQGTMA